MANITNNFENIIQSSGGGDIETIKSNILQTIIKIKEHKNHVRSYVNDSFEDFMLNLSNTDNYSIEVEKLVQEAENLIKETGNSFNNEIFSANEELSKCVNELHELSIGLRISERILKIDDLFQCVEEANATKEYLVVLDLLEKLKFLIFTDDLTDIDYLFHKCQCYNAIRVKYLVQTHILKENLEQRFERLMKITNKQTPNAKCVIIQISQNIDQLQEISFALFQASYNPKKLCEFLLENCFIPIISKPVSLEITTVTDYKQLTLSYSLKDLGSSLRPSYKQVLDQIKYIFQYLDEINVSVCKEKYVFTIFGDNIKNELLELLINDCLANAVPDTFNQLTESTLIEDVLEFEHFLADIFFINIEEDQQLTKFTNKFDEYHQNRLAKKIQNNVTEIMHRDLQDMIIVAENVELTADYMNNEKTKFMLTRCMISKNTMELIAILNHIMRQWNEKHDDFLIQLISAVFDQYINDMPVIHKKLIASIPQQSALFHNNCMFLADWIAKNTDENMKSCTLLIKSLQTTGQLHLSTQVKHQEYIIMGILRELDFSDVETLSGGHLKLIRQCLRQLDLLKNVWQNVLPENIYNEIFCNLLDSFCGDIIKRILKIEDIPANVAKQMSDLIVVVLEKVPLLFKQKHEVVHIKSWMKLEQLKLILNAALKDIVELWCNGSGILTANYRAEEIKFLIRALFQNTDRRANALLQIV